MEPHFERVTIIGVGLLGASLGLALKARGMVKTVVGVGRRTESLEKALAKKAIDSYTLEIAQGLAQADAVFIATPAALVNRTLDSIRDHIGPKTLVTDVASTKAAICAHAANTWPQPRTFVGSHPMAGSEKFGPEFGRADFYENSVCLVEEDPALAPGARESIVAMWEALGARVTSIRPQQHDLLLAHTSHLPHVYASAIAALAGRQGEIRPFIGNGFRDVTRIAGSRPEIWRDISITNREAMLAGLKDFQQLLSDFSTHLEQNDAAALEAFFELGRAARHKAVEE